MEEKEYAAVLVEMKQALALRYRQCCELVRELWGVERRTLLTKRTAEHSDYLSSPACRDPLQRR